MKSGLKFLEVAGENGHSEVIAPGSWSDLPQVAQSHAAGSTSQPHSRNTSAAGWKAESG